MKCFTVAGTSSLLEDHSLLRLILILIITLFISKIYNVHIVECINGKNVNKIVQFFNISKSKRNENTMYTSKNTRLWSNSTYLKQNFLVSVVKY